MPSMADIVLTDAEATPVNHTFKPTSNSDGVTRFHDRSPSAAILYPGLSASVTIPQPATDGTQADPSKRRRKVRIKLELPTGMTLGTNDAGLTPPPTVSHVHRYELTADLPEIGSLQERKNIRAMFVDALGEALIKALLEDNEVFYG